MRLMNLYYHAFRAFRKYTKDDPKSQKLRNAIIHSNHKNDVFKTIKYECKIEEDWIENIEEGLIYVEKAIREARQFIRTEGEVVPIEKVKKVSKQSVEHLSRHSSLITRMPKDKSMGIIPEKLYITEKLSDYQVYENRFIYMLLCYIRDFVQMRINDIKDKTTTYQSFINFDKNIEAESRNVQYKLEYQDLYKNDPYLLEKYQEIPLVDRVETIYAVAVSFLATPLMKEVAKAPILKPPVVKTNVLRMNQNFKAALKLYDFISSYTGDGYLIEEKIESFKPISPEMSDEIAETIELTSLISYVTGNEIKDILEEKIVQKEQEEIDAKNRKEASELRRLKKRIIEMNEDPTEYILRLEKRNIQLERESRKLNEEIEKNKQLTLMNEALRNESKDLRKSIDDLEVMMNDKNGEIDTLNQKYFDDMTYAESVHQLELTAQSNQHQKVIAYLNETKRIEKEALKETFNKERDELFKTHEQEKADITKKYDIRAELSGKNIHKLEQEILALSTEIESYEARVLAFEREVDILNEEKQFSNAQYLALKSQQGLLTSEDNYASKEKFKQLELEMKAYKKLFKEQWKLAKKNIRESAKEDSLRNKNKQQKNNNDRDN